MGGEVSAGDKVLIHAGSGGIGTIAIQIAKHLGAFVATTTSAANTQMVTDLGADQVIDYQTQEFHEELAGLDVVLDVLGGETLKNSFKVLRKGGRLVSLMGDAPEEMGAKYGVTYQPFYSWSRGEQLSELAGLLADGTIRPVVDRTYGLDETQGAYDYSQSGRANGKIVIEVKTA